MLDEEARALLCRLGDHLRDVVVAVRASAPPLSLSAVAGRTIADTIYEIDKIGDEALLRWVENHWPEPVEVIAEGLDEAVVVGEGEPTWTLIVDVLDGTRGLMYDKRAAWALVAAAPRDPNALTRTPTLRDLAAAVMTEVPTTKQWASDQVSAVRGGPLMATRADVRSGAGDPGGPVELRPSQATGFQHGFASFARFLPQGKEMLAHFEERLWRELHPAEDYAELAIFDDQYLSTGGQFYELIAGRDRMLGDLRPLAFAELGLPSALACHPYDCCTTLVVEAAGGVVVDPFGEPLDCPLDTTSPVSWIGFANRTLADRVLAVLPKLLAEVFPSSA
jgi:fructose-1,6-bisphosphatase/inositol monophosphatase family enzyme